jgi:hypothetical protein
MKLILAPYNFANMPKNEWH